MRDITIPLSHLKQPLRIAHVSDLHIAHAPFRTAADMALLAEQLAREQPEIICITGDLIINTHPNLQELRLGLGHVRALNIPIIAVLGDHETTGGRAEEAADLLSRSGIHILRDSSMTISVGALRIAIYGTRDHSTEDIDWEHLATFPKTKADLHIILTHNAEWTEIRPALVSGCIVLGGHTHGGQMHIHAALTRFFMWFIGYAGIHTAGLRLRSNHAIHIDTGWGTHAVPLRTRNVSGGFTMLHITGERKR